MNLYRNGHENGDSEEKGVLISVLKKTANSLIDLIPPYHTIVGELRSKEMGTDSAWYVVVGDERVSVDASVFEELMEGQRLRIRTTRRKRAISIERLPIGK